VKKMLPYAVGILVLAVLIVSAVTYQVRESHVAVVARFGKPKRVVTVPGLHGKLPWPLENVYILDNRKRVYETSYTETLTRDSQNVILLNYAIWRIADPLSFLQAMGSVAAAEERLDGMITSAKNGIMGNYDLSAMVSTDPSMLKVEEIERAIVAEVQGTAREQIGFQRLALPEENIRNVFDKMRAARAQFAARWIAEGEREGDNIRSKTDLERKQILSEAIQRSAVIRGQAEAEAARIYAQAHSEDAEFYQFLRSLESLKRILGDRTTVILRTDNPPFDVMEAPKGVAHE